MMKKLYYFVAVLFTLICSWQIWQNPETFISYLGQFSPTACILPITYNVVSVDPKFGLDPSDFKSVTDQAAKIWNANFNIPVLLYSTTSFDVKVNLVYDARQSETQKLSQLNELINADKGEYSSISDERKQLLSVYQLSLQKYNNDLAIYNQKVAEYQTSVRYWNNLGGAPKEQYASLESLRLELTALSSQLKNEQDYVNSQVNKINSVTSQLNNTAQTVNQKVNVYNSSDLIGSEFEQGIYSLKGYDRQINIYQYDNKIKLLKVLEHEFGHALGLGHSSSTESIMYKINEDNKQIIDKNDIKQVIGNCYVKTWWNQLVKKIPFMK